MKERIKIGDVLYTVTDETYYVLNGVSKYEDKYRTESLWSSFQLLKKDGWRKSGKITLSDYTPVDLFVRADENLAVWKEIELDGENDSLLEDIANSKLEMNSKGFNYLGVPVEKNEPIYINNRKIYKRSKRVSTNALQYANYKCEINENHFTFLRKKDNLPYMEPHHLVPMKYSDSFDVSLDVEENVVSLCSNCHNQLHYGADVEKILEVLFKKRVDLLESVGIKITLEDLIDMYL